MSGWRPWAVRLPALAGVLCALWLLVAQISPLVNAVTYDESTFVADAHRVSMGQVPYRDFFSFTSPGTYYLLCGGPWAWGGRYETAARYVVLLSVLLAWGLMARALARAGADGWLALLVTALYPACFFSFAPYSPHHWLASSALLVSVSLGAVALWEPVGRVPWVATGAAAGGAACLLQTEGALAALWLALLVLCASPSLAEGLRRGARMATGWVTAVAACFLPLVALGGRREIWKDVVFWPLTRYRQPGNINDVAFLADVPERLDKLWAPGAGLFKASVGTLLYCVILLVGSGVLLLSLWTLTSALGRGPRRPARVVAAVMTAAGASVFALSNPTWVHLSYALPPLLLLWALIHLIEIRERPRAKSALLWGCGALLLLSVVVHGGRCLRWPAGWELADVDRVDRESPLNRSIRALPMLRPGDRIVAMPQGAPVYLYAYPAAIGFTQFFPLDAGFSDLEDHRRAAAQIEAVKPKIILVHRVSYGSFLDPRSPVAAILHKAYLPLSQTPAVIMLGRRPPRSADATSGASVPRGGERR